MYVLIAAGHFDGRLLIFDAGEFVNVCMCMYVYLCGCVFVSRCCAEVTAVLRAHGRGSLAVAEWGCAAIFNLALNDEIRQRLGAAGACEGGWVLCFCVVERSRAEGGRAGRDRAAVAVW